MPNPEALLITKTLTFTPTNPPRPHGKYVFQRVAPGKGNIAGRPAWDLQLRAHVIPVDPQTPAQVARRDHFRAAVAFWHASTAQDREQWKKTAENRSIPVFNAALSDLLQNYNYVDGLLVKK